MDYNFRSSTAQRLVNALLMDMPIRGYNSVWIDFGFDKAEDPDMLYAAYQHALKTGQASPEDFDKAVGDGPALTVLISSTDPEMTVRTMYDM